MAGDVKAVVEVSLHGSQRLLLVLISLKSTPATHFRVYNARVAVDGSSVILVS